MMSLPSSLAFLEGDLIPKKSLIAFPRRLERREEDLVQALQDLANALEDAVHKVIQAVTKLEPALLDLVPVQRENADDEISEAMQHLDDASDRVNHDDGNTRQHLEQALDDLDQIGGDEFS